MLGVLMVVFVAFLACCAGALALRFLKPDLDAAESFGFCGALGLAFGGLVSLPLGLIPGGLHLPVFFLVMGIPAAFGSKHLFKGLQCKWSSAVWPPIALALLTAIALVGVLAPCDSMDWDSLAYHLAVPKLWLQQGHVGFVQGIHHSNFPFTAEMLYVWGLQWGGETGAKAFNLCWYLLGCTALFGLARRWYGKAEGKSLSAWWAALAFAGCPVILWEAGTAYIDIPHGLFCGLAGLYLADALTSTDKRFWVMCGLSLGFAMGTKHTGLQTFGAIVVVSAVFFLAQRLSKKGAESIKPSPNFKGLAIALGLAIAIASPWYIKSIAYTGNPVYPFFYKQLGGKYWDAWRTSIYTEEQKSFGVGSSPVKLGHAVLGLAYQPGRYVNPGQTEGGGFPTGAIGFAALLAGFLLSCSGQATSREKIVLGVVGVSLFAWFLLSQQSRYLTSIVVPLSVLVAGVASRLKLGRVVAVAVGLQAAYSCWMLWTTQTQRQLPVVTGQVSREQYQTRSVAFFVPAQFINTLPAVEKVALYDEVFGFLLDKPYMWGNPGHTTLIPYERSEDANQLVSSMKELGFSHAYVNLQLVDPTFRERWLHAMSDQPFTSVERDEMHKDPNLWWRFLFAEGVREGRFKLVQVFPLGTDQPRSMLFELAR